MATRKDIIQQIKSDLSDNLTTANGYNVQPVVVKQGIHNWNDFKGQMPSLHFAITEDEPIEDVYGSGGPRAMIVYFYGHAETNGEDNSETIYDMAEDMETFLESSHFTYNDTTFLRGLKIKEGGVSDPVTSFSIEVAIKY